MHLTLEILFLFFFILTRAQNIRNKLFPGNFNVTDCPKNVLPIFGEVRHPYCVLKHSDLDHADK